LSARALKGWGVSIEACWERAVHAGFHEVIYDVALDMCRVASSSGEQDTRMEREEIYRGRSYTTLLGPC